MTTVQIILLICLCVFVIIMVGVTVYDSNRFVMREYTVENDKIDKDRDFLFLSDLHARVYGKNNEELLEKLLELDVEGAFLAGDMMTATPGFDNSFAIEFIKKLSDKMPVYYSEGNHEYRAMLYPEEYGSMYEDYCRELESFGVKLLRNEKVSIPSMDIYALSIERDYYIRRKKMHMAMNYTESLLGKNDSDKFSVLLAHDPEYFPSYQAFGADLVLSGHFHGGIARIPGFKGIVSPRLTLFPKYDGGMFAEKSSKMIVSRGIGAHSFFLRPFNPPEYIVIHIKKK